MLPTDHKIRQDLTACVRDLLEQIHQIRDAAHGIETPESPYIEECGWKRSRWTQDV